MSNFTFLPRQLSEIAKSAIRAEGYILSDPRSACFHTRFTLEAIIHWLYRHESSLNMPYDDRLGTLLHEPSFQNLVPQPVFQKARVIQKVGNQAVHSTSLIRQYDALQVVKELFHICFWLVRTYMPGVSLQSVTWQDARIPKPVAAAEVVPRKELQTLETQLEQQHRAALKAQQERDVLDTQIQQLRLELAEARALSETVPDTHDYSEAETRLYLIDVDLHRAGWPLDQKRDREYEVIGMPNAKGIGYVDYVLWGDDGKPLAAVEAKRTTADPAKGKQQAKLYADCLEQMHGQRPIIFYTNGYKTHLWDDNYYPPRQVAGFYKKDELSRLILRRTQRQKLDVARVKDAIVNRYYQKRAIGSISEQFTNARCKALLVMATGTGKTRTAIALVDVLQRAGWVKRALFLADRISLVNQAVGAFKQHLPESSPVNLVTEKDIEGRVYVCTYPTMLNLIDQSDGSEVKYSVGHFDLVIIDEAHRSVYQKYGAIFQYFDSLLVGLTATPREDVDRNTYDLFELEPGVPTDAYELETAVTDEFLVPPRVQQVDLRFPREGIDYDSLSDEEKEHWESLDWGDEVQEHGMPTQVNAAAVNSWLFNQNTVDLVLKHIMENGHKVDGGDRLAKTIIFARNHDHAEFIEKRFNIHYPHYKGHFARVVDHYATYPQSLIDDFSQKNKDPHIAISVDMLDTGIDIPEVANLVFFKPVYSKIKFWQMIGRGTRLCPDLFGPGDNKMDFRVFDFCFNFDFFNENPDGIRESGGVPLGTRLFRNRVQLMGLIKDFPEFDPELNLHSSIIDGLFTEVSAMNRENFIVRMQLESVERFQNKDTWDSLNEHDRETLMCEIAGLPSEIELGEIESRLFDLTALRMQLSVINSDKMAFEKARRRVVEMAELLEEKSTIPAVRKQLSYLAALQELSFWQDITLEMLEEMRLRLRDIVPFLDKKKRHIVYSNFQDEIMEVRDDGGIVVPKMTGAQYEKKVREYLKSHLRDDVIQRLRTNQHLSEIDLQRLEDQLTDIGEEDGKTLLSNMLEKTTAPSLQWFVRSLIGMDRTAAQEAFSQFLSDRSLAPQQIRFVELIIDQLTARGVMPAAALYEPPFSNLHAGGPEELFGGKENVINGIFVTLNKVHSNLKAVGIQPTTKI